MREVLEVGQSVSSGCPENQFVEPLDFIGVNRTCNMLDGNPTLAYSGPHQRLGAIVIDGTSMEIILDVTLHMAHFIVEDFLSFY